MDEALRREVRWLTTRLGVIVKEQCGLKTFAAIENLRKLARQLRQSFDPAVAEAKEREVNRLSLAEASQVAHAFSLFFHLVNLAEERQRIRRLVEYDRHEAGAPMSLGHTFNQLRLHRVPPEAVAKLLGSMRIEPVLTAHPTEAKRRSVINHILRIGRTLDLLDGDQSHSAAAQLDPWIEALWLTPEVRERQVAPETEIESTIVYLERTIYDLAGAFWAEFHKQAERFHPELEPPEPFLRFGSWVGTDRDGNPNVTPEVSLKAAGELRQSILRYYRQRCQPLLGILSFPCSKPSVERKIRLDLESDMKHFPATRAFEEIDQPHELYRRKVRVILWRLERRAENAPGAYRNSAEFIEDLKKLEALIGEDSSPRLAFAGPGKLRATAQVFGFHGASLDFRQHSSVLRSAAEEVLQAAGLPTQPEAARISAIQLLLSRPSSPAKVAWSESGRRTLSEFRALRQIQERHGPDAAHRYILSMTARLPDIWDVLLVAAQAGLVGSAPAAERGSGRRAKGLDAGHPVLTSRIDVIPLFETYDDLHACPGLLDQLLSDPLYRHLLHSRGEFQEVMLGYSDSVKDSGYVAANFALYQARKQLGQVTERHGVRLSLFHGIGGTIDRGGGQSYRSVRAQPYAAPGGRIRITEQGEVISLKYSNPLIAQRNIEQLVTSVLDAHLLAPGRMLAVQARAIEEWESFAEEMAASSRQFYRDLVYETPDFPRYFYQATPIDLIEQLRLGSRPSRRQRAGAYGDLRDLRAIPWVFAWTQSRHFLPSWYGLGYALEKFVNDHAPSGLDRLRAMYQGWPIFTVLIDNAESSLAKTDLYIAGRYADLVKPTSLGRRIFARIEEEYRRSLKSVLAVSNRSHLLARQPVLAESIQVRNPYVDPLNFLQIRFLKQWRRGPKQPEELLRVLQISIAGVAFGMKSTG